jgi:hypothetical protein
MGYIYLINEWNTNNYKIGVTKANSLDKRKLELQTGNSSELIVSKYFITSNPYKLEKLLHQYYYKNNIINEWFILNDDQVRNFIKICIKYNDMLNFMKEENNFCKFLK